MLGGLTRHFEVASKVAKNFVDGIGKNIFRCEMPEIDVVNSGTIFKIVLHAWSGDDKVESEVGVTLEFRIVGGFAKENT